MNNVIVRGQKQYVDLNRKLNLHNGSVVLLKNPDVISITITKQTPTEYFKSIRKEKTHGTDY